MRTVFAEAYSRHIIFVIQQLFETSKETLGI